MRLADEIYALAMRPDQVMPHFATEADRKRIGENVRNALRSATRITVDDEVIAAAEELSLEHPDVLKQMLFRARPAGRVAWYEYNYAPVAEVAGLPVAKDCVGRIGVLIEQLHPTEPHYEMTVFWILDLGRGRQVLPAPASVSYRLTEPMVTDPDEFERHEGSAIKLMGSGFVGKLDPTEDAEAYTLDDAPEFRRRLCNEIARHAMLAVSPKYSEPYRLALQREASYQRYCDQANYLMDEILRQQQGTWRLVIGLLALLSEREYVSFSEPVREAKQRMVGNKATPFLSFRTAKLTLPRKIVARKVLKSLVGRIPPKQHLVSPQWRQSRRPETLNCEHGWVAETGTRERCVFCRGARWHVREHERGDKDRGQVVKEYIAVKG